MTKRMAPRVESHLMVVSQQLVQEVDGFVGDKSLVFRGNETVPGLLLEAAENVVVLSVQLNLVLVKVVEQIVRAEDLSNLDQLIRVAVPMEERLLPEDHGRKHGA